MGDAFKPVESKCIVKLTEEKIEKRGYLGHGFARSHQVIDDDHHHGQDETRLKEIVVTTHHPAAPIGAVLSSVNHASLINPPQFINVFFLKNRR